MRYCSNAVSVLFCHRAFCHTEKSSTLSRVLVTLGFARLPGRWLRVTLKDKIVSERDQQHDPDHVQPVHLVRCHTARRRAQIPQALVGDRLLDPEDGTLERRFRLRAEAVRKLLTPCAIASSGKNGSESDAVLIRSIIILAYLLSLSILSIASFSVTALSCVDGMPIPMPACSIRRTFEN